MSQIHSRHLRNKDLRHQLQTTEEEEELTNHLHEADLVDDGDHVHLAHVVAGVRGLDVAYMQRPSGGVVPRHAESRDERDGALVDGEQHLAVQVHPRHLEVQGKVMG